MITKELNGIKVGDRVEYEGYKGYVAVINPGESIHYLLRLEGFNGCDGNSFWGYDWFPESERKEEKNCIWSRKENFKVITPKAKFKVGDKVRSIPGGWQFYQDELENPSAMSFLKSDKNCIKGTITKISYSDAHNNWWYKIDNYRNMFSEEAVELIPDTKDENILANEHIEKAIEYYKQPEPELCIGRENKIMSNIKEFFNDLTVSAEDKELREAGLKDNDLNWTGDAISIVKDLEAKERGYKNWDKISAETGWNNVSTLEIDELFKKFYDKLLSTAKKYNKKNIKK